MPKRKRSPESWVEAALDAVTRFSRRMRDEWREGEAEVRRSQTEPEPEPEPHTSRKTGRAPAPAPWWEVLQVPRTATKQEIRRAYRRLIKENHPDKAAHLSAETQAVVERAAKRLNDAYERAMNRP